RALAAQMPPETHVGSRDAVRIRGRLTPMSGSCRLASALTRGAEHRRAPRLHDAQERALALRTRIAVAPVHDERIRRARLLDIDDGLAVVLLERTLDRSHDGSREHTHLATAERAGDAPRIELRHEERFGRLDVSDAGEQRLVEQRRLDRELALAELGVKLIGV